MPGALEAICPLRSFVLLLIAQVHEALCPLRPSILLLRALIQQERLAHLVAGLDKV